MDAHDSEKHSGEGSLDDLTDEELFERLRKANVPSENPDKQSLTEYIDEQEQKENRPNPSGNHSQENGG